MRGGSLQYPEPRAGKFCQVLGCNRVCARGLKWVPSVEDTNRIPLHAMRKHAWAMVLCKSQPTRRKVCKVPPSSNPGAST